MKRGIGGVRVHLGQHSDSVQGPRLPPHGKKSSRVVSSLFLLADFLLSFLNDCLYLICCKLYISFCLVCLCIEINSVGEFSLLYMSKEGC